MRALLVAAIISAASFAGSAALAQPHERIAVGKLEVFGEPGMPSERLEKLRNNLLGGFAAIGLTVIPDDEVKRKVGDNPALLQCQSDLCFKALGDAVGARYVVAGTLSISSATSFSADVRLVDVRSGQPAAKYSNTCTPCGGDEANNWITLVAADLKRQVDAAAPRATTTTAIGAPVETAPNVPPPTVSAQKVWAVRGAAIASWALAAGGFIIGGVEKSRDGRSCAVASGASDCTGRRDTVAGQAFGFTVGSVFLVGAAVLTYYGWFHWRGRTMALVPSATPSSVAASFSLRF